MDTYSNELYHFGIKGMKWGVRRFQNKDGTLTAKGKKRYSEESKLVPVQKGVSVNSNGSITIDKGVSLQRLVSDKSRPIENITYASVLEYDNAKYVKYIGGKGIFGGGRNKILQLKAKENLKSPSVDDATKIMVDLLQSNSEFRNNFTSAFGIGISDKEMQSMIKNPTGDIAKLWYHELNVAMTFTSDFDPKSPIVQKHYKNALIKNGYNMLRDENDFKNGLTKAPVIILDPEKTLNIVSSNDITDELRKSSKEVLKEYKSLGKNWVDRYVYK